MILLCNKKTFEGIVSYLDFTEYVRFLVLNAIDILTSLFAENFYAFGDQIGKKLLL